LIVQTIRFSLIAIFILIKAVIWRFFKELGHNLEFGGTLEEYTNTDLVLDLGGDSLGDVYGIIPCLNILHSIYLGWIIGKPVIIYAQSIGPFNDIITRNFSKFILKRVDLITVREKITMNYLNEIGIDGSHIYLTSDSGFLLESTPKKTIMNILKMEGVPINKKPLIGISPGQSISRWAVNDHQNPKERYKRYVKFMAKVSDYLVEKLVEKLDATVILIPHVMTLDGDKIVSRKIYNSVKNKSRVNIITKEYTTDVMKGIIGACDLLIGSRTHSTVASTSMNVPTISLAYSHKSQGIIGDMLGQDEFIVDIREMNFDNLFSETIRKIDLIWPQREEIKSELKKRMVKVKKNAMMNAKLVKFLITHDTVEKIYENNLCSGCGTCVSVCPSDAIKIQINSNGFYIPKIDKEKCIGCGKCLKVCPANGINFDEFNKRLFNKSSKDAILGNFINSYTGYSMDYKIRKESSSGGLVTELLIFALEKGIIDAVIVTRMSASKPLEPEVFIARSKKEIISASRSKYCPVPLNLILKKVMDSTEKFAIVGLPCHIHGIRLRSHAKFFSNRNISREDVYKKGGCFRNKI